MIQRGWLAESGLLHRTANAVRPLKTASRVQITHHPPSLWNSWAWASPSRSKREARKDLGVQLSSIPPDLSSQELVNWHERLLRAHWMGWYMWQVRSS